MDPKETHNKTLPGTYISDPRVNTPRNAEATAPVIPS